MPKERSWGSPMFCHNGWPVSFETPARPRKGAPTMWRLRRKTKKRPQGTKGERWGGVQEPKVQLISLHTWPDPAVGFPCLTKPASKCHSRVIAWSKNKRPKLTIAKFYSLCCWISHPSQNKREGINTTQELAPRVLSHGSRIVLTCAKTPPRGGGMIEAQIGIGGMVGWAWEGLSGRTF